MKKIVALALSLVMVLALCTTAFAVVPLWTETEAGTVKLDTFDAKFNTKTNAAPVEFERVAAKAPTYDKDGVCTAVGNIEYYRNVADGACYTLSDKWSKDATLAVKAHDEKLAVNDQTTPDAMYFLTYVSAVSYSYEGKVFTAWGDKCGQFKKPADADKVKYVESKLGICPVTAGDEAYAADHSNVMVDGKIYTADQNQKQAAIEHKWVVASKNDKNEVLTYKCTVCGTVGTVVPSAYAPEAQGKTLIKIGNDLVAFSYTAGKAADGKGTSSPKTFDAGIAMYVGMSLMSVAGSAVVIGKKKEF